MSALWTGTQISDIKYQDSRGSKWDLKSGEWVEFGLAVSVLRMFLVVENSSNGRGGKNKKKSEKLNQST